MSNLSDTPAWVRDAVFYQIFPDRFASSERVVKPGPLEPWDARPTHHGYKGGDLLGIAEHLDYLADLGITALYLTPIFSSASNHRYHTYDYFNVDPLLGGNDALRELLDKAHARRRVQPLRAWLRAVPPRRREWRRLALRRLVLRRSGRAPIRSRPAALSLAAGAARNGRRRR